MIDQAIPEGGEVVPFAGENVIPTREWKYRPYGYILQVEWKPQTMIGQIHLPQNMKKMPFYRVRVIACGPDCKLVKPNDWILIPAQMIQEATWDGNSAYFTGENQILAVVE